LTPCRYLLQTSNRPIHSSPIHTLQELREGALRLLIDSKIFYSQLSYSHPAGAARGRAPPPDRLQNFIHSSPIHTLQELREGALRLLIDSKIFYSQLSYSHPAGAARGRAPPPHRLGLHRAQALNIFYSQLPYAHPNLSIYANIYVYVI